MPNKLFLLIFLSFFQNSVAFSQVYDGKTLNLADLQQIVNPVKSGDILILGENHGLQAHRDQHLQVLQALREKGLKVSVGMEFVNYTDQAVLNQYTSKEITEEQFLKQIGWAGFSFDFYRDQINFPNHANGETTLGLNIPRTVTSKISKNGIELLPPEDKNLLPPNFELGRDSYKERFMEVAGHHCKVPDNCFAAQSVWDDTMAWTATDFMKNNSDQVLVIIVGEFHVQYGGGLPDRIKARGFKGTVRTLSQVWAEGLTPEEVQQELQASQTEGPRADFIWVSAP